MNSIHQLQTRTRRWAYAAAICAATALAATPAHAQTRPASEDDPVDLPDFIVDASQDRGYQASAAISATRISTPVADMPMSIQIFTEDFITDIGAVNMDSVLEFSAAVTKSGTDSTNNEGTANFTIRGFETSFVMRNGFRHSRNFDPLLVQRVEVVKGPSSLLYGQVPAGGVINYITKRAQIGDIRRVSGTVGSYSQYRGQVDFNTTLDPGETMAFRVLGSVETRQGRERHFKLNNKVIAPMFLWRPSNNTSVHLEFTYLRKDINAPVGMLPLVDTDDFRGDRRLRVFLPVPRDFNIRGIDTFSDSRDFTGTLEVIHRFNDTWSGRAVIAHSDNSFERMSGGTGLMNRNARTLARIHGGNAFTQDYWTGQADLLGRFQIGDVEWNMVVGAEAFVRKSTTTNRSLPADMPDRNLLWDYDDQSTWIPDTPNYPDDFFISSNSSGRNESRSAFISNQFNFFDGRLRLLGGLRYDDYKTSGMNLLSGEASRGFSGSRTSPQIGGLFKITPEVSIFANYTESFEPQNRTLRDRENTLRRDDGLEFETTDADPLVGEAYEVGFKFDLLDNRISATLSHYRVDNVGIVRRVQERPHPTQDPVLQSLDYDVQSGSNRTEGWELDFIVNITPQWQLLGSFALMDGFVLSNEENPDQEGQLRANVPKRKYALYTNYIFDEGPLEGLSLRAGTVYTGEREGIEQFAFFVPLDSYQTFELGATYSWTVRDIDYRVNLVAKNIFDEHYMASRFQAGEPRRFIATLSVDF
ncbi:MAG: TonB-dependent receptor [Opitutales bacterium]|nr:TonB-dependent receptor [Opitutales bacterium]